MHQSPSASDTINRLRAFIALALPDTVRAAIRHAQDQLAGHRLNVRWVKAENIHLTLKFLGEIDADRLNDVAAAVADATVNRTPFHLSAKGLGAFPNVKRARIIWVGLAGQVNALNGLQMSVENSLVAIGFPSENRRFTGHLTLGRSKGVIDARRLVIAMDEVRTFQSEPFLADQVIIYRSDLQPSGAVYTQLHKVLLKPGNAQS